MKHFKLLIASIIILASVLIPFQGVSAQSDVAAQDDGIICITVIEEEPDSGISAYSTATTTKTKTGKKTTYYYNSSGDLLWYVSVKATFSYDGSTATCTSATVTAESQNSHWVISNRKCSRSSNYATASATGKFYVLSIVVQSVNKSVTLTCSKNGTLS